MTSHIVTGHQANYFPYLGFFEKVSVSDCFVLVDDTQFVKRGPFGWIHRNRILNEQGQPQWLTIPVVTHDRYEQLIREVEIDEKTPWQRKHWRSIEFAYRKSNFFKELGPELKDILERSWTKLAPLSQTIIEWMMSKLNIQTPIILSSELQLQEHGSAYVLELTKATKATHYISGIHGKDYLDLDSFQNEGIEIIFQEFDCTPYPQRGTKNFISHLSTLDALFQVGPEACRELLKQGAKYTIPSS